MNENKTATTIKSSVIHTVDTRFVNVYKIAARKSNTIDTKRDVE